MNPSPGGQPEQSEPPLRSMSCVYYVMDGDDILVSTTGARARGKATAHNPKLSFCILDEKWPPTHLLVYCDARIETGPSKVVELMQRIAGVMAGKPMPDSVRPIVEEGAKREGRIVVRCTPYETFHSQPKQVRDAKDVSETLLHGLGDAMPW